MRCVALALFALPTLAGAALHFDGGQRLRVDDCPALDITSDITIEVWVKPDADATKTNLTFILSKNYNNTGYGFLTAGRGPKTVRATGWPNGNITDFVIEPARWTHLAFVRNSRMSVLYVNGKEINRTPNDGPLVANDLPLWLGGSNFGVTESCNWVGALKEVRIFNVARSAQNIRRTMSRRLSKRQKHLAAYFPMNEGKGSVVHDRTGHTAGATIVGSGPTWVKDR